LLAFASDAAARRPAPEGDPSVTVFGYHCSHEQFSPVELLDCARLAEGAGFERASASDHFHPWSER
jgi:alkanesulfonate monooxygenase SsuD/methylene tetrahydromethanopterin reductase-like flavin-dependent oxidoreductase (luciferase family)